jgi:hypothetical protein
MQSTLLEGRVVGSRERRRNENNVDGRVMRGRQPSNRREVEDWMELDWTQKPKGF